MKQENITCEVIQDLLPLYKDGCCSEQSKKLVEEHLTDCKECREMDRLYQDTLPDTLPGAKVAEEADVQGIKQEFAKLIVGKDVALCL